MGNYYEGEMVFILRHDTPTEIIDDLRTLAKYRRQCSAYNEDTFGILQKTKWFKHERFYYPNYYFETYSCMHGSTGYVFKVVFYIEGYVIERDDLGKDIYNTLKPYIDEPAYDIYNCQYLGKVHDEDGTYNKTFYVNEDKAKQEMEKRKYLCNSKCHIWNKNDLCDNYKICHRAYLIGQKQKKQE